MSTPALQRDFDRCVTLFSDFIKQMESRECESNISEVDSTRRCVTFKDTQVEDHYYKKSEYAKLSNKQKKKLKEMREACGHQLPSKKQKTEQKTTANTRLQMIKRQLAQVLTKFEDKGEEKKDDENEQEHLGTSSNGNNPALNRQCAVRK
jgi:tRNA U34 5-carboxymethylaminomethyl modifying GTPase MnmE/TrmE